ncbi:hypothetical protein Peur_003713 [Populus x canadensis]
MHSAVQFRCYSSETMNISAGANNCSGLDIIMGRGRKEEYKILRTCSTVKTTLGLAEWVILEKENRMLGQTKHACFSVRLYANLNDTL